MAFNQCLTENTQTNQLFDVTFKNVNTTTINNAPYVPKSVVSLNCSTISNYNILNIDNQTIFLNNFPSIPTGNITLTMPPVVGNTGFTIRIVTNDSSYLSWLYTPPIGQLYLITTDSSLFFTGIATPSNLNVPIITYPFPEGDYSQDAVVELICDGTQWLGVGCSALSH